MMPRQLLTVLIPTYNEERNLPDCLASIAGLADDLVVVDSFSSDATPALAAAAGARVLSREFLNDADQKNWALGHCRHDWVLILDADERLTPQLRSEILALLSDATRMQADAYSIARTTFFLGIEIRHCWWDSDRVTRLFDRRRGRYPDREVHGDLVVAGSVSRLDSKLLHYTYQTFDDYLDKLRRYTTWSANDMWKRGKRTGLTTLATRPVGRFLKMYVLRRGFLDGSAGFVVCALAAISVFVRYCKLWAMQRALTNDARWPDGRRVIHAGAAIAEDPEIISGGRSPGLAARDRRAVGAGSRDLDPA